MNVGELREMLAKVPADSRVVIETLFVDTPEHDGMVRVERSDDYRLLCIKSYSYGQAARRTA